MSKLKNRKEFRTLRRNKSGVGSIVILSPTVDGTVIFQTAKQEGTTPDGKFPKFNYANKQFFAFNDLECAKIVRAIEKEFLFFDTTGGTKETKLVFHHKASSDPKIISFSFSVYNNNIQCGLQVNNGNDKNKSTSIYINEEELEIIKEMLRQQYSAKGQVDGYPSKVVFPDGTVKDVTLPALSINQAYNDHFIYAVQYDTNEDANVYFLKK
jgi:hypothetical protein